MYSVTCTNTCLVTAGVAGPLLSPLGVASLHSHGAVDWDDDRTPTQDSIGVIGKGRF